MLVGTMTQSSHADWRPGDQVILNGFGVGEGHWGGLAQNASFRGDWLVPLPKAFTTTQAMAIGTAGSTAALSIDALVSHGVTLGAVVRHRSRGAAAHLVRQWLLLVGQFRHGAGHDAVGRRHAGAAALVR